MYNISHIVLSQSVLGVTPGTYTFCAVSWIVNQHIVYSPSLRTIFHIWQQHIFYSLSNLEPTHCGQSLRPGKQILIIVSQLAPTHCIQYLTSSTQTLCADSHILWKLLHTFCTVSHTLKKKNSVQSLTPGTHTFFSIFHTWHPHIVFSISHLAPTYCVQSLTPGAHTLCSVSQTCQLNSVQSLISVTNTLYTVLHI